MANKSPFNFLKVCYVADNTGDQHIFETGLRILEGNSERVARSLCGKTAGDISKDPKGYTDAVEYKDRLPDRPLCQKCQEKYKKHPRSPWKAWQQSVKAG